MKESLKRKMWDYIRPFHAPLTRKLRKRLSRNFFEHPEIELPPPFEAIQMDVERHLHDYLHVAPQDISQIVIVGAHEADEVERLRRLYQRASFSCFEPNPNTVKRLIKQFGHKPYVTIFELALSDTPGQVNFFELDIPGNGSLLEPDLEAGIKAFGWKKKEAFAFGVNASTLDIEIAFLPTIDLLWMDVQGAEAQVLNGGMKTLGRTKAVFLEVALVKSPYKGSAFYPQINAILQANGFSCVGLGVDASNAFGNAFFVKNFEALICK